MVSLCAFIRLLFQFVGSIYWQTNVSVCCVPMLLQIGVVLVLVFVFIVTHFTNFFLSYFFQKCTCGGQIHAIVVCRVQRNWLVAFAPSLFSFSLSKFNYTTSKTQFRSRVPLLTTMGCTFGWKPNQLFTFKGISLPGKTWTVLSAPTHRKWT